MRRNPKPGASPSTPQPESQPESISGDRQRAPQRSGLGLLSLFAAIAYCSWSVYHYQYNHLPPPLAAEHAGKRGFSELEALEHVKALTRLGPHSLGSDALALALQVTLVPPSSSFTGFL